MLNSYDDVIAMRRMVAQHYAKAHFERARMVDDARRRRHASILAESRRQAAAPEADRDGR